MSKAKNIAKFSLIRSPFGKIYYERTKNNCFHFTKFFNPKIYYLFYLSYLFFLGFVGQAGTVGLMLSYAVGVAPLLQFFVQQTTEVENYVSRNVFFLYTNSSLVFFLKNTL